MLWILTGFFGLSGVAMGAFAAHGLKGRLDAYALEIMQTATQYQLAHTVAMLALLGCAQPSRWTGYALISFAIGIVLFSGSLYTLALTGQKWLGAITPLGGLALLGGWSLVIVNGLSTRL